MVEQELTEFDGMNAIEF